MVQELHHSSRMNKSLTTQRGHMTQSDKSSSRRIELTKVQWKSWAIVGPRHSRTLLPTGAVEQWQLSGEVVVVHVIVGVALLWVIWTFEYLGTQPVSTITYSQSTIPRLKVLKWLMHVFENWDSWLDKTKAYSFRKDALVMRIILHLCIFVKKDSLEIEFSSLEQRLIWLRVL